MNDLTGRNGLDPAAVSSVASAAMSGPFDDWRAILVCSVESWIDHRAASKGAALAFYALFSLAPILVLAIAIAGHLLGAEAARSDIMAQIQGLVGPSSARTIDDLLAGARDPRSISAAIGAAVLLLITATSVFVELKGSLDEIWGLGPRKGLAAVLFLRTQLHAFGLVLVLALILLISLMLSAALGVFERYADGLRVGSHESLALGASLIAFTAMASLFAVIYKALPQVTLSWRDVCVGALFTAVLFSIGKYLIGTYLAGRGVATSFGAAGSLIGLLLWVYYSAQIFFLGAEFTRHYALRCGSLKPLSDEQLLVAPCSRAPSFANNAGGASPQKLV